MLPISASAMERVVRLINVTPRIASNSDNASLMTTGESDSCAAAPRIEPARTTWTKLASSRRSLGEGIVQFGRFIKSQFSFYRTIEFVASNSVAVAPNAKSPPPRPFGATSRNRAMRKLMELVLLSAVVLAASNAHADNKAIVERAVLHTTLEWRQCIRLGCTGPTPVGVKA